MSYPPPPASPPTAARPPVPRAPLPNAAVPPKRGLIRRIGRAFARAIKWIVLRIRNYFGPIWATVRNSEKTRKQRALAAFHGTAAAGFLTGVFGVLLVVLYAALLFPFTPSVADLRSAREANPSVAMSADGVEMARFARKNKEWIALADIADPVVKTLIATEDRRFYSHSGLDFRRTAGAMVRTAMGDRQGGSTITQQLARNLFPERVGRNASVTRKLKEALTAWKIEAVYSKDEILELYLNSVPFLYNAYGIEMAARTYFSTSAEDLNQVQAATLVGMLKGTSSYNPKRNPERALARRNVVLNQLVVTGQMRQTEYDSLKTRPIGLKFERQPLQTSRAPHFTEYVRQSLEKWAEDEGYNLYGDGLVIHTTLNWGMQEAATESVNRYGSALQAVADVEWARGSDRQLGPTTEPYVTARRSVQPFERFWEMRPEVANAFIAETDAYKEAIAAGEQREAVLERLRNDNAVRATVREAHMRLEMGFCAIDPRTGEVKAWVGSRDYNKGQYDHVARAKRQPGSIFKPFLFARALEEGYSPNDRFRDEVVEVKMDNEVIWRPTNSVRESGEEMSLSDALAYSKNTIAVQLIQEVGPRDVARTAKRMGVNRSEIEAVPSLALGTSEVTLLEMTSAHSTIAGLGVYREPLVVTSIDDADGNEIARFAPDPKVALDDASSVLLLDMMRGVIDRGTGRDVRNRFGLRGDYAGKTGTTQDGADGWFMLMHPDLVAGAWVGFDDPRVTFRSSYWGQGGHNAGRLVGDFFQTAQRRKLVDASHTFPPPPEIVEGRGWFSRAADWTVGIFERLLPDRSPATRDDSYGPRTPNNRTQPQAPAPRRQRPEPQREAPVESAPPDSDPVWDEPWWEDEPLQDEAQGVIDEVRRRAEEQARDALDEAGQELRDRAEEAAGEAARRAEQEIRDRLPNLRLERQPGDNGGQNQ